MVKKGSWLSGTQFLKAAVFKTHSPLLAYLRAYYPQILLRWQFTPVSLMTSFLEEFLCLYSGFACIWHPMEKTFQTLI